jgi:hypothetical protein
MGGAPLLQPFCLLDLCSEASKLDAFLFAGPPNLDLPEAACTRNSLYEMTINVLSLCRYLEGESETIPLTSSCLPGGTF